ncbi:hypothetical protein PF008_g1258 [Phytophthora fragariae]|uniref:RxLR effector protein n=1 Tax=Phytophthora fragariae TaxID=53985 RepID=A0A6G0SMK4_9STRA|nr:hypothetical protein PF008_g1258 [Phytophthora fragariae]
MPPWIERSLRSFAVAGLSSWLLQCDTGSCLPACGQGTSDTDGMTSGTTPVYQHPPPSPTYSPTSTTESDDEDDHSDNRNLPSRPQQLQLQPTVPDRQVQHVAPPVQPPLPTVQPALPAVHQAPPAMQLAVLAAAPAALQSQWEGTRLLGPPPSWESLFYYVAQ